VGVLFEKPPDLAAFFIVGFTPHQDIMTPGVSKDEIQPAEVTDSFSC